VNSHGIILPSVFKYGRMNRICVCGMQAVVRKSYGLRYAVFTRMRVHVVYMRIHAVYMRVHTVYMWVNAVTIRIHAVNMRVYVVYMRVHAVYNVIVEYFFYYSLFKNNKKPHICVRMKIQIYGCIPHMQYAVTFRIHEKIRI
jgi:hypothetical protein